MATRISAARCAKLLPTLCLTVALLGCATAHSTAGRDFDTQKASQIVKGTTTSGEVVALFGEPYSRQLKDSDTVMWLYSYADVTAHANARPFGVRKVETTGTKKCDGPGRLDRFREE
jgi:hypothetical protein